MMNQMLPQHYSSCRIYGIVLFSTYAHFAALKGHSSCLVSDKRLNPTKMIIVPHTLTSRVVWLFSEKGWSSDFPPLPSAFSSNN